MVCSLWVSLVFWFVCMIMGFAGPVVCVFLVVFLVVCVFFFRVCVVVFVESLFGGFLLCFWRLSCCLYFVIG